jgi:hypothetical protein
MRHRQMKYHRLYGASREERAQRMVNNSAPENELVPRATTYVVARPPAHFDTCRYVESITNGCSRSYVVVRSQKFHLKRKYYQVQIGIPASALLHPLGLDSHQWRCNCRDPVTRCKHVIAIELLYKITVCIFRL